MKNLKTLLCVGLVTVCVMLLNMTPNHAQNQKISKYKIIHNGHVICLPALAVEAHIREHNREGGKFTCTKQGLCSDQPTVPTIPPTTTPPPVTEPICHGCQ